ncbi:poly alpha-glucosyltransferase [Acinetobacter sp. ANC 3813]|uniref:poly alpha-glucosyltransferase n=1 Tax=Acinetobacter sp. ANC 3813 TaxID=1977873 RepID=UPI000A32DFDE|nr:poly alpha-glucosyltransferase [Acinetobacter sp. ANC 3813]OTG86053.1 poly alpha-glucosyltransferase [Acinetobacter sp. ANC 3813]
MTISSYKELQSFKEKITIWVQQNSQNIQPKYGLFLSYGDKKNRCKVWNNVDTDIGKVLKRTCTFLDKIFEKNSRLLEYVKLDYLINLEQKSWNELVKEVNTQKHNNHYRKGIGFDSNLEISFLEQEMYGKAIIRGVVYSEPNFLDEKNLNNAIHKKYPNITKEYSFDKIENIWVFDTIAAFYENGELLELYSTGPENGIRKPNKSRKEEIKKIVLDNAEFLYRDIIESGRFCYGYFPAFDREIKSYNTVRHCTAIYALLETLEVEYNSKYLDKIKKSIQYAIDEFYKVVDDKAFMIDSANDGIEIKLGSNAAAIFMFAKYQEITEDNKYKEIAENLAKGIMHMVDEYGETTHILDYPSLKLKEKFRIVYYDGEAALGLLRLYQINNDKKLLDTVKLMFEHFITKNYDKYHDHWLSYCTNELTKICPEEKYFQFGLDNYLKHMKFIYERKTAYATFLEMMMSAHKMVKRMNEQGYSELFDQAKFEELKELIEHRVEFQRATGYFYPEMAMYMAKPDKILNAFYVRHDRFRTRIDDQEHNLSGYVAYINHF